MSDLMKIGSDWGGAGVFKPFTSTISGAQRTSDAHGRYLDALLAGRIFKQSIAAGAPTAYVGAAAGTPLLCIHNPANSNKIASIYIVGYAARGQVTAAGTTGLAIWSGPSAFPTQATLSPPVNALSLAASGSAMVGFSNVALTASTALALSLPLNDFHLIGATPVSESRGNGLFDIGGIITLLPGNQAAIGMTTVPTGLTCDLSWFWEETPSLVQI